MLSVFNKTEKQSVLLCLQICLREKSAGRFGAWRFQITCVNAGASLMGFNPPVVATTHEVRTPVYRS